MAFGNLYFSLRLKPKNHHLKITEKIHNNNNNNIELPNFNSTFFPFEVSSSEKTDKYRPCLIEILKPHMNT